MWEVRGQVSVSVPDLKSSSCMEVASDGEGDKRRTDRQSFTSVHSSEQAASQTWGSGTAPHPPRGTSANISVASVIDLFWEGDL